MIFRTNGVKCGKVAACGIYKRKAPHLDELLAVWTEYEPQGQSASDQYVSKVWKSTPTNCHRDFFGDFQPSAILSM